MIVKQYIVFITYLNRLTIVLLSAATVLSSCHPASAGSVTPSGQLSGWLTATEDESQLGVRYIPELSLAQRLSSSYEISAEIAVNSQWYSDFSKWDYSDDTLTVDPYRLWARFASPQYEIRGGLQKISFGSAMLLRPLMWFDTIDPRDPLQLTEGVYGLLGRYFFLNNANIWVWTLYGNDDLKGWEGLPTDKSSIEYGGRLQLPILSGEMGFSYDHRSVDTDSIVVDSREQLQNTFPEDRFGIDGKWDLGIGIWFEGTVTYQDLGVIDLHYQRLFTVGLDYTFDIGNGLHVLGEHFESVQAEEAFGSGEQYAISALSADYPLGILDTVTAIVYYNWDEDYWSPFISWQRTYDQWQINVSAFSNPDEPLLEQDNSATTNSFAGNGIQVMLVFNH